jgi:predicted DNA-binding transcriptional regulator YafY
MTKNYDENKIVKILYTNHRGETGVREIIPIEIVFKATEYHPEEQWLLRAYVIDRQAERHFALSEIKAWF